MPRRRATRHSRGSPATTRRTSSARMQQRPTSSCRTRMPAPRGAAARKRRSHPLRARRSSATGRPTRTTRTRTRTQFTAMLTMWMPRRTTRRMRLPHRPLCTSAATRTTAVATPTTSPSRTARTRSMGSRTSSTPRTSCSTRPTASRACRMPGKRCARTRGSRHTRTCWRALTMPLRACTCRAWWVARVA